MLQFTPFAFEPARGFPLNRAGAIESISAGERVHCVPHDDPTGDVVLREVAKSYHNPPQPLYVVKVGDLSIWTTQHHPFWTDDRGWVAAAELCNGDLLRTLDGTLLPVAEVRVSDIIEPVFNLRVEECHTFFVGDDRCSILMHNQSPATSSAATFAPVVVPRPAPSSAAPAGAGSVRSSLSPPSSVGVPAHIPSTGTPDDEEPRNADEVRAFGWLPDLGGDNYSRQRLIKNYRKNIQDRATADFNKRLEGLRDYAQEYVDQGLISQEDADRIVAGAKGPFIHAAGQPFDSIRDAENQLAAEAQRIRAKEGETDAPSPPVPSTDAGGARKGGGRNQNTPRQMSVGDAGHHVPAVRKSRDRPFEIDRNDKSRPTIHVIGNDTDKARAHWRMHEAERPYIGRRQGDFSGTDRELFDAYRKSYEDLGDIRVDVRSPDGKTTLGTNVSLVEAIDLIENYLSK